MLVDFNWLIHGFYMAFTGMRRLKIRTRSRSGPRASKNELDGLSGARPSMPTTTNTAGASRRSTARAASPGGGPAGGTAGAAGTTGARGRGAGRGAAAAGRGRATRACHIRRPTAP